MDGSTPYDETITEQQREVQEALRGMPEFAALLVEDDEPESESLEGQ